MKYKCEIWDRNKVEDSLSIASINNDFLEMDELGDLN